MFTLMMVNIYMLGYNLIFFSSMALTAPSGPGPPHYPGFTVTLKHTKLSRTPLDE
jgi:hypothetical protein